MSTLMSETTLASFATRTPVMFSTVPGHQSHHNLSLRSCLHGLHRSPCPIRTSRTSCHASCPRLWRVANAAHFISSSASQHLFQAIRPAQHFVGACSTCLYPKVHQSPYSNDSDASDASLTTVRPPVSLPNPAQGPSPTFSIGASAIVNQCCQCFTSVFYGFGNSFVTYLSITYSLH